jgi:hypothetical protein
MLMVVVGGSVVVVVAVRRYEEGRCVIYVEGAGLGF